MGKLALLMVAGLIFTFGVTNTNMNRFSLEAVDNVAEYHNISAARNTAKAALSYALYTLSKDSGYRGTYEEVDKYTKGVIDTVTITDGLNDKIDISVISWCDTKKYEVVASVKKD